MSGLMFPKPERRGKRAPTRIRTKRPVGTKRRDAKAAGYVDPLKCVCVDCGAARDQRSGSARCRRCYNALRRAPGPCIRCPLTQRMSGKRICVLCHNQESKERMEALRRRRGRPTFAEACEAKRKPPKKCIDCAERWALKWKRPCQPCSWQRSKPTTKRVVRDAERSRARAAALAANENGDSRRCRACGLWKRREKHFSLIPGGNGARRLKCAACYSAAQAARNKAAGIVVGYERIDRDSWQHVVELAGGLCAYCRIKPWTDREHIIPVTKGGPTELWNLTIACRACNVRKKNHAGWFPKVTHPWMREESAYRWWEAATA